MRICALIFTTFIGLSYLWAAPNGEVFSVEGSGREYAQVLPKVPNGWTAQQPVYTYTVAEPGQKRGDGRAFVFASVPEDEMDPRIAPSAESQRLRELTIITARGEYETATFGIYAFEPLRNLKVSVTDLELPHEVRYSSWLWVAADAYAKVCRPIEVALVRGACDLNPRHATRFWITVWAKPGTLPKTYQGIVTVRDELGLIARFPIKVHVLPITLPEPPSHYALWYGPVWAWGYEGQVEKHFQQVREYGLTSVVMANIHPRLSVASDGSIEVGFEPVDKVADAFTLAGMKGPIVLDLRWVNGWCSNYGRAMEEAKGDVKKVSRVDGGYEVKPFASPYTVEAFMQVVKTAMAHAKKRGWPQAWFYVQEEGTNEKVRVEQLRYFAPLLHKVGAKGMLVSNALWWLPHDESEFIGDYWDVLSYNFFTHEVVKRIRTANRQLSGFNLLGGYRRSAGFYAMRTGLVHVSFWAYQWGRPFPDGERGLFRNWFYALPSLDGPVPTQRLMLLREGIDDARYLAALNPEQRHKFLALLEQRIPLDTPSLGLRYHPTNGERECHALRAIVIKMLLGEKAPKSIPGATPPSSFAPVQNILSNGDMEVRAEDGTPANWHPHLKDLPVETHQVRTEAAMGGRYGLQLRCTPEQEHRAIFVQQSIPNPLALRGKRLRLTCHFRIHKGQGVLSLRMRCWSGGKWVGDACRIWIPIERDKVSIVAWQNNRVWGRFPLKQPRGRWVKTFSEGIVPLATDFVDVFFGISAEEGEPLEVDVDECRLEIMEPEQLQILPAWNIATPQGEMLPLFVYFPPSLRGQMVQLSLFLDGHTISPPLSIKALEIPHRVNISIKTCKARMHHIALAVRSRDDKRMRATTSFFIVRPFTAPMLREKKVEK